MTSDHPTVLHHGVAYSSTNPHSWLRLLGDPSGTCGPGRVRVMYGVLRPEYQNQPNSAAAFARAKLVVPARPDPTDWTITAHRAEVLLPAVADDWLLCARTLFEEVDTHLPPDGRALATYITLTWMPTRLHHQWELGRSLARWLAEVFEVAVLLVQHVPSHNQCSALPHLHLLVAGPRRILPWGFGTYVADLGRESGRRLIVDKVAELVAGGRS